MPISRHAFAGVNTDDDPGTKPATAYDAGLNLALEPGRVDPMRGNVLVPYALPAEGATKGLGALVDGASSTLLAFYYNSDGHHRLARYDPAGNAGAGSIVTLLEWVGLKLSPDLNIEGGVIDGLLVFRDRDGELRCVDLRQAEAGAYTATYLAAEPFALHLVKVPPTVPPTFSRQTISTGDPRQDLRIVQGKAFQFSYRWRYAGGQLTPQSGFSEWADVLTNPAAVTFNCLVINLPTPVPRGVMEVDVLVREAATGVWQVAETLRRSSAGVLPGTLNFYGQILGTALTEAESAKLFEACWPCGTVAIGRSRVFEANLLEGYPTPEPAFTAEVNLGNSETVPGTLYAVQVNGFEPGPPAQNDEPVPDVPYTHYSYFTEAAGTYPDPASTYNPVLLTGSGSGRTYTVLTASVLSYEAAFVTPETGEVDRQVEISQVQYAVVGEADLSTFHERSAYRVSIQFYDALGRPYGCSQPRTVYIPRRAPGDASYRSIRATLTTTDLAALQQEIPPGAYSYSWLVARNERCTYFLQGTAADVLGYLGRKTIINDTNGEVEHIEQVVDVIHTAHEKVLVDIGNFAAVGLGYIFQRGDLILFRNEDKIFPILDQRGDYLEVGWTGYPDKSTDAQGRTQAAIEIYSPNTTSASVYYERGPRLSIVRSGPGQRRSYSQPSVVLDGDCFLVPLNFPIINRQDDDAVKGSYVPPNKKEFTAAPAQTLVESMVPPYRLAPVTTTTTIVHERQQKGVYDGFFGIKNQESVNVSTSTETTVQLAARAADALLWLDMSWGGRPGVVVPAQLQQVQRNVVRYGNEKQQGNLLNGLGSFEPLSLYDKLPQEQGPVKALVLADQSQTDGSVLLAIQQYGTTSLYLGQQPIRTDPNQQLIITSNQVIGGDNTLKGGFGCSDAGSATVYAGKAFFLCRERSEFVRYHNGNEALALGYKFENRLRATVRQYAGGPVRVLFDPRRKEAWVVFQPWNGYAGRTLIWSEKRLAWADMCSGVPDAGQGLGDELVTWKDGSLYRHTPDAPVGEFYGQYTSPWVQITVAPPDDTAKRWMNLEVRTTGQVWNANAISTDTGQLSKTKEGWWQQRDGIWRLPTGLRRDTNSLGFASEGEALDRGGLLISPRFTATFVCPIRNPQPLSGVQVSWQPQAGQTMGVS